MSDGADEQRAQGTIQPDERDANPSSAAAALTSANAAEKMANISAQFKELAHMCSSVKPVAPGPVTPVLTSVGSVSIKAVRLC